MSTEGVGSQPTAASGFRYDVFLCHNRLEKPVVKDIADALQVDAGILFFLDEYAIPASVEFLAFIRDEMRRCAACAIFLGPAGWGPTHLMEAQLALELRKHRPEFRIIPVALPEAKENEWESLFGIGETPQFNWVQFASIADDEGRTKLIDAVQGRFTSKAAGPEAVTPYYIRRQAALWEKSKRRDDSLLLRGSLLRVAQAQAASNPAFVSMNAAPAFLARSAEAERNRLRVRLALAVAAVVVATALAATALWQRQAALRAARIALGRSLAALAPTSIGVDRNDERGALLARQAYLIDEADGGPSSYLTTASLAEVLGTPYFSSAFRVPDGKWVNDVSPSGAYLIAGGEHPILIGPVVTSNGRRGQPTVMRMSDDIKFATFDPVDDAIWVSTQSGEVQLRDATEPGRVLKQIASLRNPAANLVISNDRTQIVAVIGDKDLISIDVSTRTKIEWHVPARIHSLEMASHGDAVAITDEENYNLAVFRIGASAPFATYPGDDAVNTFAFDPTGDGILVGERGGKVWRWRLNGGDGTRVELGPQWPGSIDTLAVSANGRLVAAASGSITPGIELWHGSDFGNTPVVIPGVRTVVLLRLTKDGRFLVSADTAGDTRYWRLEGAGTQRSVRADRYQSLPLPGRLYSVVRNPKSDTLIVGGDHAVLQVWPTSTLNDPPRILAAQRAAALSTVPDLQGFESNGRNYLLTGHVMAVAISGDGKRFATVDPYGFALVWSLNNLDRTPRLIDSQSTQHATFAVALSPNGRRLAVGATSTLTIVHDIDEAGAAVSSTPIPLDGDDTVRALLFTDDEHLLVGDDAGRVTRWTLSSPRRSEQIIASGPLITAIAPLRNGGGIVVARGEQVDIVRQGQEGASVTTVIRGLGGATSLAVSDDGALLAVGFSDGSIRIWSVGNLRQAPVTLPGHRDYVRSLAFDRSGEVIVSVGDDGVIQSSTVGRHRLAAVVCGLVWRDLDADEVKEFFGDFEAHLPTCPNGNPPYKFE